MDEIVLWFRNVKCLQCLTNTNALEEKANFKKMTTIALMVNCVCRVTNPPIENL